MAKTYGEGSSSGYYAWAYQIIESEDNGFLIVGEAYNNSVLIKLNNVGDTLWAKSFTKMSSPSAISETQDNGILLGGSSFNLGAGYNDAYLIKTDSLGNSDCFTNPFSISMNTINLIPHTYGAVGSTGGTTNGFMFNTINTSPTLCKLCEIDLAQADFVYSDTGLTVYFTDTSDYASQWQWDFGDFTTNSTTQNPVHTFSESGSYYVCLTSSNECSSSQFCTNIIIMPTNISSKTDKDELVIFPNPSTGEFTITISNADNPSLQLFNVFGIECDSMILKNGTNQIDLSNFPKGIYFISFSTRNNKTVRKIIIQ